MGSALSASSGAALTARQAALLLAASIILLGVNWPVLKIGLRAITPLWFSDLRLFLAAILYALPLAATRRLVWPPRSEYGIILGLGLFQGAVMLGLITLGLQWVGAGRSAIVCYTMPVWVIPGAMLFLGERPTRRQAVGLVFGLVGIVVLFDPFDFDWSNGHVVLGNLCCLLAAMAWSVALLQVRRHRWRIDPLAIMPHQSLLAALLLLPAAGLGEGWIPRIAWSGESVLAFSYTVVLSTCIGFWFIVVAARRLPAIGVSLAQMATPAIGVLASALWIGETPTPYDLAGLGLIIAGVVLPVVLRPAALPAASRSRAA